MTRWLPVLGFEDLYAVSDQGQVKSLSRPRRRAERVLAQQRERLRPYWFVTLWHGKKAHHRRVHNLILEAFVGPRPEGAFGLHADDDPDHNTLANLRWGTRSENTLDMVRNGRHNHARKTHCKHGHPLSGPNVRVTSKQRVCLACARRRRAEHEQRHALAVYAADLRSGVAS